MLSAFFPVPKEGRKKTQWAWITGTFFGMGMAGKGGGTLASVATVGIWWFASKEVAPDDRTWVTAAAAAFITVIGIFAADIVAIELDKKDPGEVVIDEVAGQLIALIAVPLDWKYVVVSLILFRGFDIVKPPPVRQMERVPGGAGIVLDDVAAGLYALLFTHALMRLNLF